MGDTQACLESKPTPTVFPESFGDIPPPLRRRQTGKTSSYCTTTVATDYINQYFITTVVQAGVDNTAQSDVVLVFQCNFVHYNQSYDIMAAPSQGDL